MSDDVSYFNQTLWQHNDKQISNSFLTFSKFTVSDQYGISPVKLKMSVSPFKSNNGNYIYLTHQDVCTILCKIKKYETDLASIMKSLAADQNKQINISVKLKKNIIITFLYRIEYGGGCVRIILSDRDKDYIDSEKVFLPIYEFVSLTKILGQFRDSYVMISDNTNN
jgi:hypothetical protein